MYHVLRDLSPPGLNLDPYSPPDAAESDSEEATRHADGNEGGEGEVNSPDSASHSEGVQGVEGAQSQSVPLSPLASPFVPGREWESESGSGRLSHPSLSPSPSGGGRGWGGWSSSSPLSPLAPAFSPGRDAHVSRAELTRGLEGLSLSESEEDEVTAQGLAVSGGDGSTGPRPPGPVGSSSIQVRRGRRRRRKVKTRWVIKVRPEIGSLSRAEVRYLMRSVLLEIGRRYKRALRKGARDGLARDDGIHVESLGLVRGDTQDWNMWKIGFEWSVSNFVCSKADETMDRKMTVLHPLGEIVAARVVPWRSYAERRRAETERERTLRQQRDAAADASRSVGRKTLRVATWNVNGGLSGNNRQSRATQAMLRRVLAGQDVLAVQETRRKRGAKRMFIPGYVVYESQADARPEARGVALIVRSSLVPKVMKRTPTTVTVLVTPGNGAKKMVVTAVYVSPHRRTALVGRRNLGMAVRLGGDGRTKTRLLMGDFNMTGTRVADAVKGWEGGERLGVLPNRAPTRLGGSRAIDHVLFDGRGRILKVDGAGATVSDHYVVYAEVEAVGWGGPGRAQGVGGVDRGDALQVDRKLLTPGVLEEMGRETRWGDLEEKIRLVMGEGGRAAWEGEARKWWRRVVALMVEEERCLMAFTDGSAKVWTDGSGEVRTAVGYGVHWSNDLERQDVVASLSVEEDGGEDVGLTIDNNRAELEAVIAVLEEVEQDEPVMVVSDSLLVVNFLLHGFECDNRMGLAASPLRQNASRWQRLDDLVSGRDGLVLVAKVAAHKKVLENEVADHLAKKGAALSVDESVATVFGDAEAVDPLTRPGEFVRVGDLEPGDVRMGLPGLARSQGRKMEVAVMEARSDREFRRRTRGLEEGTIPGLGSWPRERKEECLGVLQTEVDEEYEGMMVAVTESLKEAQLAKQLGRRGRFENKRNWTQYRYLGAGTRGLIKELRETGRELRRMDRDGMIESPAGTEMLEKRRLLKESVAKEMVEDRKKGWIKAVHTMTELTKTGSDPAKLARLLRRVGSSKRGSVLDPDTGLPYSESAVVRLRKRNGDLTKSEQEAADVFARHYGDLGVDTTGRAKATPGNRVWWLHRLERRALAQKCKTGYYKEQLPAHVGQELDKGIAYEEWVRALRGLKSRKAAGLDGLPAEVLRAGVEEDRLGWSLSPFGEMLWTMARLWWRSGRLPTVLGVVRIVSIPKKGDKSLAGNYRGIAITGVLYKVFASVMADRAQRLLISRLSEVQAGFRVGEESTLAAGAVLDIVAGRAKKGERTAGLFLDTKKAFPSAPTAGVLAKLERWVFGTGGESSSLFMRALAGMYRSASGVAQVGKSVSSSFPIDIGVRQGCPISPLLFVVFMDDLFDVYRDSEGEYMFGATVDGKKYPGSIFADDVVRLVDEDDEGRNVAKAAKDQQEWARFNMLEMNSSKSGILVFTGSKEEEREVRESVRLPCMMCHQEVAIVDKYVYLGITLTSTLETEAMINGRAVSVRKKWHGFARLLSNERIPMGVKKAVWMTYLAPTFYYGAALWCWGVKSLERKKMTDGLKEARKVQRQGMNLVFGKHRFDGGASRWVYERALGVPPPEAWVWAARVRVFDKMDRVLGTRQRLLDAAEANGVDAETILARLLTWVPGGACLLPSLWNSMGELPWMESVVETWMRVWRMKLGPKSMTKLAMELGRLQIGRPREAYKTKSWQWFDGAGFPEMETCMLELELEHQAVRGGSHFVLAARARAYASTRRLWHARPTRYRQVRGQCVLCRQIVGGDSYGPYTEGTHMLVACDTLRDIRCWAKVGRLLEQAKDRLVRERMSMSATELAKVMLGGKGQARCDQGGHREVHADWLWAGGHGPYRKIPYESSSERRPGGETSVLYRLTRFGKVAHALRWYASMSIEKRNPEMHPLKWFTPNEGDVGLWFLRRPVWDA